MNIAVYIYDETDEEKHFVITQNQVISGMDYEEIGVLEMLGYPGDRGNHFNQMRAYAKARGADGIVNLSASPSDRDTVFFFGTLIRIVGEKN